MFNALNSWCPFIFLKHNIVCCSHSEMLKCKAAMTLFKQSFVPIQWSESRSETVFHVKRKLHSFVT